LAEVLGSAVALKLLFGLPLIAGVCLTSLDVLIVLVVNNKRFHTLEALVGMLILVIAVCFMAQLVLSRPDPIALFAGFIPRTSIFSQKDMLLVAIGIIGATVMPHNLFLHSSIVLTRKIDRENEEAVVEAIHYNNLDSTVSLSLAFFINAAILIVSAATFHKEGLTTVATLEDAHRLLDPLLHSSAASVLFAVALLAAGQNSTLTGTLAGQIVMEGFTHWTLSPVARRAITRLLAIVPAIIATAVGGDNSANTLLIMSQVVLSFTLPFGVVPLVIMTSNEEIMTKKFVNTRFVQIVAWVLSLLIIVLNIFLLV
jgi:manganese transport protein